MLIPSAEQPFADFKHLYYPILGAAVIMFLRFIFERFVFRPWGVMLGIKPRRAKLDPEIKAAFEKGEVGVVELKKSRQLNERQLERLRRRHNALSKPETLSKFCENSWRFFFYTGMTFYGCWVLKDKAWTWNITDCWRGYPKHVSI
ncbi:unnamed protein product, partial [Notodromas monacha]